MIKGWSKGKKVAMGIALAVVLLVSSFFVVQFIQLKNTQRIFEEQQKKRQEELAQLQKEQAEAKDGMDTIYQEDRVNVLIMGFDKDESRLDYWRLFRPDALVLVSMNLKDDTIDLISFPRDALVWIAHRPGKDKINASFYYGHDLGKGKTDEERIEEGYRYTVDTVSEFLGNVYINNYLALDMDAFVRLVDDMGGVEIDMDPIDYDPVEWAILYGKKGPQTLNGYELLMYLRYRAKDSTLDAARASRTQDVLQAVYQQFRKKNMLTMIPKMMDNYKENVDTNLSLKEMSALALYAQKLDLGSMRKHLVLGDYDYRDNNIYYIPDETARIQLVKDVFGFDFKPQR